MVSSISVSQRADDSNLVDISFNLADADGDDCTVWVSVSDDGGTNNWRVPMDKFSGAIGQSVSPGTNKHITWDAEQDMSDKAGTFKVRVFADDGNGPDSMVLVPGGYYFDALAGKDVFIDSFMIAKYETTVSQYCQFLNAADWDERYWHQRQEINKKFIVGPRYGSSDHTIKSGRENYPVRSVSFFDAEAYAAWKSSTTGLVYRLPTEQEWEKAAGWDPELQKLWTYGFQSNSIDCNRCNYNKCVGKSRETREIGYYDGVNPSTLDSKSYYGCYDMSGNVWEWTSSIYSGSSRVLRGGYWGTYATFCAVTHRGSGSPASRYKDTGFRLVLDLN